MQHIVSHALEIFIQDHLAHIHVRGIILIGSAADGRFIPGKSDIDVIVITADSPLQRGKLTLQDTYNTPVDYTLGTADEILDNYLHGAGQAFAWLLASCFIYRDDQNRTARQLADKITAGTCVTIPAAPAPAWRIGLTNRCNFDCFFCHSEGLTSTAGYQQPDFDKIYTLILHGIRQNCRDFTLTGGEPLLYAKDICRLLHKLSRHPAKPFITIVTNGLLLSEELLAAANAYVNIKFNISYHATEPSVFQQIIRRDNGEYHKVTNNIRLLQNYQIKFGLNYVLLRNLNDQPEQIESVLSFAKETGAHTVKFLELLIIDKLIAFYDSYCDVRYIKHLLHDRLIPDGQQIRRQEYRLKDSSLRIYIQRCRCRLGCDKCMAGMDRILTPDGSYEPCFSISDALYPINNFQLSAAFDAGDKLIEAMSNKHGHRSPLLVSDPEYTTTKTDYFYLTSLTDEQFCQQLQANGWNLERINKFAETYYRPASALPTAEDYHIVHKSFVNYDFPNRHKFFSASLSYNLTSCGSYETTTQFLSPQGPRECTASELEHALHNMNLTPWFSLNWRLKYFSHAQDQLTAGICLTTNTLVICAIQKPLSAELQQAFQLTPLTQPLIKYIQNPQ